MRNPRAAVFDMIMSLAVIMVPCVLIYALFTRTPDEPEVPVAQWGPVVAEARKSAPYQVMAPTALPDSWKPVRARFHGNELQLGFLAPGDVYHEVKQRPGATQPGFVRDITRGGIEEGTSTVQGRTWTRYLSEDERSRCLVSVTGKDGDAASKPSTTVACADLPYEGVEAFVGSFG